MLAFATLAIAACAPAPQWIAVGVPRAILVFDRDLRPAIRLDVAGTPTQLRFAPDGASLFVTVSGAEGAYLTRIRRSRDQRADSRLAGDFPRLVLTPDGRTLIAADAADSQLVLAGSGSLAMQRRIPVCPAARELLMREAADRVYVICRDDHVVEIDPDLGLVLQRVPLGAEGIGCGAAGGSLSANGTVVFVVCSAAGRILYLDRVTLQPFDSMPVPRGAGRLIAIPGGGRAVLAIPDSARLAILDLRQHVVLRSVVAPRPTDIALSADGSAVFVIGDRSLVRVALASRATAGISLTDSAAALAVWPQAAEPRMRWDRTAGGAGGALSSDASAVPAGRR